MRILLWFCKDQYYWQQYFSRKLITASLNIAGLKALFSLKMSIMARCFFCHIFRNRKHLDLLSLKGFFLYLAKGKSYNKNKKCFPNYPKWFRNYFGLSTRQKRKKILSPLFRPNVSKRKTNLDLFVSFCRVLLQLHVFALLTGLPVYVVILSERTFFDTLITWAPRWHHPHTVIYFVWYLLGCRSCGAGQHTPSRRASWWHCYCN